VMRMRVDITLHRVMRLNGRDFFCVRMLDRR
jgi:hypothetical protein